MGDECLATADDRGAHRSHSAPRCVPRMPRTWPVAWDMWDGGERTVAPKSEAWDGDCWFLGILRLVLGHFGTFKSKPGLLQSDNGAGVLYCPSNFASTTAIEH